MLIGMGGLLFINGGKIRYFMGQWQLNGNSLVSQDYRIQKDRPNLKPESTISFIPDHLEFD